MKKSLSTPEKKALPRTTERKVRAKKVPAPTAVPAAPAAEEPKTSDEPVVLRLDELTILKLSKYQAQIRAVTSEISMQSTQRQAYVKQVDPKGLLDIYDKKILALKDEYVAAKNEYILVAEKVKATLGVDLKQYTYDEQTGVLHANTEAHAKSQEKK